MRPLLHSPSTISLCVARAGAFAIRYLLFLVALVLVAPPKAMADDTPPQLRLDWNSNPWYPGWFHSIPGYYVGWTTYHTLIIRNLDSTDLQIVGFDAY